MKASSKKVKVTRYEPIELTITFESEEEAKAFYSVMNTVPISDYLRSNGVDTGDIRGALNKQGISSQNITGVLFSLRKYFGVD